MEYQVVYDFSQESYSWLLSLIPLGVIAIAIIVWMKRAYVPGPTWWRNLTGPVVVLVISFTLCATAYGLVGSLSVYNEAQQILREGRAVVIEGLVEDFKYERAIESFTVDGVMFDYANADSTAGFHTTSRNGGPINRDGLYVRVYYAYLSGSPKPTILRLEVKQ